MLAACQPVTGAMDPLDSGEQSAILLRPGPSSPERQDELRVQDRRVDRLGGQPESGGHWRCNAGVDAAADF